VKPPTPYVLTSSPTASSKLASAPCSSKTAGAHSVTVSAWYTLTPGYPLPIEPDGQPSSRMTTTANSLEPKLSTTRQPNRRANSSTSGSVASLPNAARSVFSASSGFSGVLSTKASGLPT
jgi:hypothetical protein